MSRLSATSHASSEPGARVCPAAANTTRHGARLQLRGAASAGASSSDEPGSAGFSGPAMSSRTPSGVEICSPDTFDYYDISNAVYQRLEHRGLSTHRSNDAKCCVVCALILTLYGSDCRYG